MPNALSQLPAASAEDTTAEATAAAATTTVAATSGVGLQILSAPASPSPPPNLLPVLDDQARREATQPRQEQAQIVTTELPPVQQRIQLFERPPNNDEDKQQIIDGSKTNRLARLTAGKQATMVSTTVQEGGTDVAKLINTLLDEVNYIKGLVHKQISGTEAASSTTPLQVRIGTFITNSTTGVQVEDKMQGAGDDWQKAL